MSRLSMQQNTSSPTVVTTPMSMVPQLEKYSRDTKYKMLGFFTDQSLTWATAVWQGKEQTSLFENFIAIFKQVFDHAPEGKEVNERLISLWQGHWICSWVSHLIVRKQMEWDCPQSHISQWTFNHADWLCQIQYYSWATMATKTQSHFHNLGKMDKFWNGLKIVWKAVFYIIAMNSTSVKSPDRLLWKNWALQWTQHLDTILCQIAKLRDWTWNATITGVQAVDQ